MEARVMMVRAAKTVFVSALLLHPAALFSAPVDANTIDRAIADAKSMMLVDPNETRFKAAVAKTQAEQLASKNLRLKAIATADWLQAEALVRLDKPMLAMPIVSQAIRLEDEIAPTSKLKADTLLTRGGVYVDLNQFGLALGDYQEAFRIYASVKDRRGEAMAIVDIGDLYRQSNDYDSALKYLNQADNVNIADNGMVFAVYTNRAIILQGIGRFVEAGKQFTAALEIAKRINSPQLLAQTWRHIAKCQLLRGALADADRSIAQGRVMARRAGLKDDSFMLSVMAQAALMHGNSSGARRLVDRAFAGVNLTHTALPFREAHQTAYEVYRAINRPDLALVHLAALKRLDDQATKLATTTSTALMAARFDFAKLKADDLQRKIEFERQKAKTERSAFVVTSAAAAVVMALLLFALVTSRRSRKRVDAANDDLAETNAALGKALAAKTEFLATTSHEIRTPLNGILGMTQVMLANAAITGDTRDRLGVVHSAGITMRALVDDILDVAKMETGHLTIERAPFDLAATIRDATRLWEDQARAKGIAFVCDLGGCPQMIEGDAARVRQIVFNLLSNALKFTPGGRIALKATAVDAGRYTIAIVDTGIGIPADKTTQIFELFRQADAGTTRQFGGTGLGLAICRNLARAMGGDIRVDSMVGKGSTFTVTLPLVHAAAPIPCETVGTAGPGLLIVDRNPITRAMLRALLAPHAGTVAFAASAAQAVECLPAMRVAQILIDDATIRADNDPLADLALIAEAARVRRMATTLLWPVTADRERAELLATGIDRVLAKPVSGAAMVEHMYRSPDPMAEPLVSHAA